MRKGGEDRESCSADFGKRFSDFFLLVANPRFIPIPPATAAERPLSDATGEEEETGLLRQEPMCWEGCCVSLRGGRELIFE
jgi:hypothetical protein